MTLKQHKLKSCMHWFAQFEAHQNGMLECANSKLNFRMKVILQSMTADQLSVVLSMVSIGNSEGWRQQREQTRNLRLGYGKEREVRSTFKVIKGGAA